MSNVFLFHGGWPSTMRLLDAIAQNDCDRDVRLVAVNEIYDGAVLAKIAKTDSDSAVRLAAVERLLKETYLDKVAEVAQSAGDPEVRQHAAMWLAQRKAQATSA
jgi:hypothetical protein